MVFEPPADLKVNFDALKGQHTGNIAAFDLAKIAISDRQEVDLFQREQRKMTVENLKRLTVCLPHVALIGRTRK